MNEIYNFIARFTDASPTQNITETFTNGCCYWFAFILCNRFPEAKLMYDICQNHFVAKINNKLFDITGDVTEKYDVIEWEKYDDELHKKRLIRDCIKFISQ